MKKSFVLFVGLILLASLVACNMPTSQTQSAPEMGTAAALTVQAVLTPLNSPTAESVLATPAINSTATFTSAPGTQNATPSATHTATPITLTPNKAAVISVPMLKINESTNCRTGPGQNYEIIFAFLPGATAEIVGQYPQDNYWIVKMPDNGGTCWAWGGYATATGSHWVVPTATIPPTTTPKPPDAPSIVSWEYKCAEGTLKIEWKDRSDGEEGFRVIRDDTVVAQLPPNTTSYTDNIYGIGTAKVTYYVEVFIGNLTARSSTFSFSCQ